MQIEHVGREAARRERGGPVRHVLDDAARGHVVIAEPSHDLGIGFDGDAFGHEILADHVRERVAFDVLRVAA